LNDPAANGQAGSKDRRYWSLMLTARQMQVAELVMNYKTNKEIASFLNISERTVKFHVSDLLHLLGITQRSMITREGLDDYNRQTPGRGFLYGTNLVNRDAIIFRMIGAGNSQHDIARILGITANTVRHAVKRLLHEKPSPEPIPAPAPAPVAVVMTVPASAPVRVDGYRHRRHSLRRRGSA
jgi:DNA-binding NarL/FixJ family response regulator